MFPNSSTHCSYSKTFFVVPDFVVVFFNVSSSRIRWMFIKFE